MSDGDQQLPEETWPGTGGPAPAPAPPPGYAPPPPPPPGYGTPPVYGQAPAAPGPYAYAPQPVYVQATKTNGLAIASMVLGIIWLYWVGSILAVIFGHVALHQIKQAGGQQTGRGMAIAGVVLGYVGIAILIIVIIIAATSSNTVTYSVG